MGSESLSYKYAVLISTLFTCIPRRDATDKSARNVLNFWLQPWATCRAFYLATFPCSSSFFWKTHRHSIGFRLEGRHMRSQVQFSCCASISSFIAVFQYSHTELISASASVRGFHDVWAAILLYLANRSSDTLLLTLLDTRIDILVVVGSLGALRGRSTVSSCSVSIASSSEDASPVSSS